jgi:hypothetical protein
MTRTRISPEGATISMVQPPASTLCAQSFSHRQSLALAHSVSHSFTRNLTSPCLHKSVWDCAVYVCVIVPYAGLCCEPCDVRAGHRERMSLALAYPCWVTQNPHLLGPGH